MISEEYLKIIREAERYLKELTPTDKKIGRSLFESRRALFLKQGYVSGLSGLIEACTIFLEKVKEGWSPKLETYGRYLLLRLNDIADESWRFRGEDREIVKDAYNTLRKLQKTIRDVINTRGEIDKSRLEELQKETDRILLKLYSIEKELALYTR